MPNMNQDSDYNNKCLLLYQINTLFTSNSFYHSFTFWSPPVFLYFPTPCYTCYENKSNNPLIMNTEVHSMKVLIAIDSFKGSMSSMEAGYAAKAGVLAREFDS